MFNIQGGIAETSFQAVLCGTGVLEKITAYI
jgi:hypothetical protein